MASDALAAGFGSIVLVLGPATGPAIRYHVTRTWPSHVDVRFALQEAPLGTVHAVLSASDHVGDTPYGVGNADDIYGRAASSLLAAHLTSPDADQCPGRVPPGGRRGRPCAGHARCLPGRARGPAAPGGRKAPGHGAPRRWIHRGGREGALDAVARGAGVDEPVGIHAGLPWGAEAAMDAATGASEEAEVLLPEVVAHSLSAYPFTVLPATGRCIGVTHPDDLALVQAELARQVGQGARPAALWAPPDPA